MVARLLFILVGFIFSIFQSSLVHATGVVLSPGQARIMLHYDYMVRPDGRNYAPSEAAIGMVAAAFKQHGIILDIDPIHSAIPESYVTTLSPLPEYCTGPSAIDISALKKYSFRNRGGNEHYTVFSHYSQCDSWEDCDRCNEAYGRSGIAELPGDDFIVSLGMLVDWNIYPMPDIVVAGTFMHELGHNLNLHHGGDDDFVQKPNYISVMSYTYQFGIGVVNEIKPILDNTQDPSDYYIVDYSEKAYSTTLYEGRASGENTCIDDGSQGMNEAAGMKTGENKVIVWYTNYGGDVRFALGDGSPIDWDDDGYISTRAFADVSGDGSCNVLHGFDDWTAIKKYLALTMLEKAKIARVHTD